MGNHKTEEEIAALAETGEQTSNEVMTSCNTETVSVSTPETKDDGQSSCCCGKTTERSAEEVRKLINRLNRIEGQIRGIRGMVERDAYCPDILTQSAAVTAAMNAFNRELMANHIKHCVVRDIKEGKEDTVDELVFTLQKLMK